MKLKKFIRRIDKIWTTLWTDSSRFRKSWLYLILTLVLIPVGGWFLKQCSKSEQGLVIPKKDEKLCFDGKGFYFSSILTSITLVDLDNGRILDTQAYLKSDEHLMFQQNEGAGKKEVDFKRLLNGFELKLIQIQNGYLMLGYDGFPVLLRRPRLKYVKLSRKSVHEVSKEELKASLKDVTKSEIGETLEDGIWAVKTGDRNVVALEIKGVPSTKDIPFSSPKPTKVSLDWCLHNLSWYEL